jgi:hypothetical protein
MARDVKDAVVKLEKQVEQLSLGDERAKNALVKNLNDMAKVYADLKIPKQFESEKKSLMDYIEKVYQQASQGFETPTQEKDFLKKAQTLVRYLKAGAQDFSGKTRTLRHLHLSFVIASAIFFVTWPFMINNVLVPILFFIPTIIGIMALRSRNRSAVPLMFLCYMIQLLNGALWSRYAIALVLHQVAGPGHWAYIVLTVLGCIQIPLTAFAATLTVLLRDALV